ncbi:MAG: competence/damage-inducible protein A [Bacteroidales bacterium]|nr:competence/damage-inducible protein A [Bacteroidales bacterium]
MKAELISIGDEILIGQVVNTNAAFLAEELNKLGIAVVRITTIADKAENIPAVLEEASTRAELVLTTGGLGPTSDDVTKYCLAEYFNSRVSLNPEVLERIKVFIHARGGIVNDKNAGQAMLPDNCEVLPNRSGTAQGMWFSKDNITYVALPGVPYEMKEIFQNELAPRLRRRFILPVIHHETVLTSGISESAMAKLIEEWEARLPSNISLAYLPSPGILRLRLSGTDNKPDRLLEEMRTELKKLEAVIGPYIFGYNEDRLEEITGNMLRKKGLTLSLAESCTGGKIGELITSVPGASDYFKGGIIAYSNEIKSDQLGVSPATIETYGAVSREVVHEMAAGALIRLKSDYSVAVTGVAGPAGGTDRKPVGTTWIAIAAGDKITSKVYHFGEHRGRNIQKAAITALFMLKKELEGNR